MKRAVYCICLLLLCTVMLSAILLVYRAIFKVDYSVIFATLCIIFTFPIFMNISRYGRKEIKKQERMIVSTGIHTASDNRILALCIMCMGLIYWGVFLVSLIPIVKPGMIFITLFPALALSCIPAKIVCDTYHSFTHKKTNFWCIHIAISILTAFIGQIPVQLLFM